MEKETQKKKKKSSWIWNLLIVVSVAVMAFSGYQLFRIFEEYRQGEEEYSGLNDQVDQLRNEYLTVKPTKPTKPLVTEAAVGEGEESETAESETAVNETVEMTSEEETEAPFDPEAYAQWFAQLQAINSDIVGWISIEGTVIDYPVMHSGDNSYYLYRTYQGTHNGAGSIFMEGTNWSDFSDAHTVLYGHNMKNGSMFAGLHKYRNEAYFQEHPVILVETAAGPQWYEIFSCHLVHAEDEMYSVNHVHGKTFDALVKKMKAASDYETGVEVSGEDDILTLSTCKGGGDMRYVVHAKLVQD